jgi:pimeloyl-ACP methyl ester carboxylesterase
MSTVDTLYAQSPDGTRVGCEVLGDGPALLAIHGSTADRRRWDAVREPLARRFRLHLMDRRGRGLSSAENSDGYSLEREAEDIRALVEAIGGPVLVLSHSYGGAASLEAATDCPGIARMLVYEPALSTDAASINPEGAVAEIEAAAATGDRDTILTVFFSRMLHQDDAAIEAMRATPVWQHRLAAAHTLPRETRAANDYVAEPRRLGAIGAPVRILLGTATTPALTRAAHAAHAAVPGAELVELPGHGHAAMDADPAMFVTQVEDWLLPAT